MQGDHNITHLYCKVLSAIQARPTRIAIFGIACLLGIAAVALAIHLVGHVHTTALAIQQVIDITPGSPDGEWPGG